MSTANYSILMSVYAKEQPQFLAEAIESMLKQTISTDDFVLVCDGPLTDGLEDVIKRYPLSIHRLSVNQGLSSALNYGLKFCKYDIIVRMDSDDVAVSNRLEMQLPFVESYNIVGGIVEEFKFRIGDLGFKRSTTEQDIKAFARRRNPFNHPTVMFRKADVLTVGGYENTYPLAEDYHLWIKMLMNGCKGYNIPQVLVNMRVGNGLYNRRSGWRYFIMIMKFRRWLRSIGFAGRIDYLVCAVGHALSCLSPEFIRRFLYEKKLRV